MESPLLETRACPSCPGLIAGADPRHFCLECLGDQDMAEVVPFTFAIPAGRMAPFGRRMTRTSRCRALPGPVSMEVHRPALYFPLGDDHGAWPSAPSRQQAGQRASAPLPRDKAAPNKHECIGRLDHCSSARRAHLTGSERLFGRSIGRMNSLVYGVAAAACRVMSLGDHAAWHFPKRP